MSQDFRHLPIISNNTTTDPEVENSTSTPCQNRPRFKLPTF